MSRTPFPRPTSPDARDKLKALDYEAHLRRLKRMPRWWRFLFGIKERP